MRFLVQITSFAFLGALIIGAHTANAQSGGEAPSQQTPDSSKQLPPEIARELDAMKKRIEQLEAELNKIITQERPTTVVATAKATALASVSPLAATPALTKPEAPSPEKRKPAEPFAFADFTWLNGNPRTKESPMDTKFFNINERIRHNIQRVLRPSEEWAGRYK